MWSRIDAAALEDTRAYRSAWERTLQSIRFGLDTLEKTQARLPEAGLQTERVDLLAQRYQQITRELERYRRDLAKVEPCNDQVVHIARLLRELGDALSEAHAALRTADSSTGES